MLVVARPRKEQKLCRALVRPQDFDGDVETRTDAYPAAHVGGKRCFLNQISSRFQRGSRASCPARSTKADCGTGKEIWGPGKIVATSEAPSCIYSGDKQMRTAPGGNPAMLIPDTGRV